MAEQKKKKKKGGKYRLEFSGTSLFFWSMALLFSLAWMFGLGVVVGRGMHQDGKGRQDEQVFSWKLGGKISEEGKNQGPAAKKRVQENWEYSIHDELVGGEHKEEKEQRVGEGGRLKEAGQDNGPLPESDKKGRPERGTAEQAQKGKFAVQLISFGGKGPAEELVEELGGRGYSAYWIKAEIDGNTHYRVRCGTFETRAQAEDFRLRMKHEENFRDCYVVEKEK